MLTRNKVAISLLPILGMIYLCFGLMRCIQTKAFIDEAKPATGEIISSMRANAGNRRVGNVFLYFPIVTFATDDGQAVVFQSDLPIFKSPQLKLVVPVLYLQKKGEIQAVLDSPYTIWYGHLFEVIFGLSMLVCARYIAPNKSLEYLKKL